MKCGQINGFAAENQVRKNPGHLMKISSHDQHRYRIHYAENLMGKTISRALLLNFLREAHPAIQIAGHIDPKTLQLAKNERN